MTKFRGLITLLILILCLAPGSPAYGQETSPAFADHVGNLTGPLPLSAYPRPANDNGLGIHWSTTPYGEEKEVTDYFVNEVKAMGIKWVKFLNDGVSGRHHDYLVEQLVANDIMPVARIYMRCNDPIDLGALGKMVEHYVPMGLVYYELYNEPDIHGTDGGWCKEDGTPEPERLAELWAPAAREVQARGGFPSLPSIFPVGKNVRSMDWRDSFFQQFLHAIKDQGHTRLLYASWGAVHNYAINHPPDYPVDEVNLTGRLLTAEEIARYRLNEHQVYAINKARTEQFEDHGYHLGTDPTQDVTGFLQFIAYQDQFEEIFGFKIPLISTEGGATVGSCEDPRYPCVDEEMQMAWTLAYLEYMLDEAPPWYFSNCTWFIGNKPLDFGGGTVWEINAWYQDRKGKHLPVVDALKNHPRKGAARWDLSTGLKAENVAINGAFSSLSTQTETINKLSALGRLADYPRPPEDNGWGAHYAPTILAQPTGMVDFFIEELLDLNIKWVKIMQGDVPKIEHQYLVEQLIANDIEPIIRVYKPYNEPYEHLEGLVEAAVPLGVHYFELYNEPNIGGFPGGWHDGEPVSVNRILELWLPAAEAIHNAGGYPGLPTLAPGGSYDDMKFLREFLQKLAAQKRTDLLIRAWIPLHNYFLNHPFDYPTDDVNVWSVRLTDEEIERYGLSPEQADQMNNARANSRLPGGYYVGDTIHDDSNGFRKFDAYARIFFDQFGFYIPIITTEGGPLVGDGQDPRYPILNEEDHTRLTLQGYHAMLDDAPAYYFAFAPWLMANGAGGHWDAAWEGAAWYKVDGTTMPIVDAMKADVRRWEIRDWNYGQLIKPPAAEEPKTLDIESMEFPVDKLQTEIITAGGTGPGWQVSAANWKTAATPYPRLRINVLDEHGRQLNGEQIRVEWTGGWTLLVTEPGKGHNATMPLRHPADMYVVKIAGGSGQAVRARGANGHDLNLTFQLTGGA
jgi:hypothetical protein